MGSNGPARQGRWEEHIFSISHTHFFFFSSLHYENFSSQNARKFMQRILGTTIPKLHKKDWLRFIFLRRYWKYIPFYLLPSGDKPKCVEDIGGQYFLVQIIMQVREEFHSCEAHSTLKVGFLRGWSSYIKAKESTYDFLLDTEGWVPQFYLLPKIHKGTFPAPDRPIVSGYGLSLEPLTMYPEPLIPCMTSYLKNTMDF